MSQQDNFQTRGHDNLTLPWPTRAILSLIGFNSVVAQIVLMRELMVVFYGNELSLGVMLASWLFWTACGSSWVGRRLSRAGQPRRKLAMLQTALAFALPLTVLLVRVSKLVFQAVPGEILGPVPMFVTCFAALSVFCLTSGALFTVGSGLVAEESNASASVSSGAVYLLEAAGSGLGGVLASLILVRLLSAFEIAALLGLLSLLAALVLLVPPVGAHGRAPFQVSRAGRANTLRIRRRWVASFAALGAMLVILSLSLQPSSLRMLWRGYHLLATRDSVYGNLAVVSTEGSRSLLENGLIVATLPDAAAAEEAVHFALLEHPAPRSALLIGGGLNGSVTEALTHPSIARVDYVELDPAIFEIGARYFSDNWEKLRHDPRVRLVAVDGRRYLKGSSDLYDVIIVNLPDPHTAQLNRFYTEEFFREAAERLQPGGVLSFQVTASENYFSPELADFLRCLDRTLRTVFPEVVAIPGETVHFCAAGQPGTLTADPQELTRRARARGLHTRYVREYFLPYRMSQDRMAELQAQIEPQPNTPRNRDFAPVAYYFDVALWSTRYHDVLTRGIEALAKVRFERLFAAVLIALGVLASCAWMWPAAQRAPARARRSAAFAVAALGFTGLGLEILLLMGFQALFGYVYQQLAVLVGLYMAGLAGGAWWQLRLANPELPWARIPDVRRLAALQVVAAAAPLALYSLFAQLGQVSSLGGQWLASQILFPALAFGAGALAGFEFLLASRIYFAEPHGTSASPGTLYAIDLAGACAGALALSAVLIPVYGFLRTAALMAAVNLVPAALAGASARK